MRTSPPFTHGVGLVFIDKKNNFHYLCGLCRRDSPSLELAREHNLAMLMEAVLLGEVDELETDNGKMYRFKK